nr:hypothetical protein TetV2_00242 [Oceanusvirus sp.]
MKNPFDACAEFIKQAVLSREQHVVRDTVGVSASVGDTVGISDTVGVNASVGDTVGISANVNDATVTLVLVVYAILFAYMILIRIASWLSSCCRRRRPSVPDYDRVFDNELFVED